MPDFKRERALGGLVAGVDEAGRGPVAGPVVAAAAILVPSLIPRRLLSRVDDSKALKAVEREDLALAFRELAAKGAMFFAIGCGSTPEIERINILQASLLAMRRAVARLPVTPTHILVDGPIVPAGLPCRAEGLVDGDALSLSIAAASIVAKVTRDRIMARLARRYPAYGWERNAGYGTPQHQEGLRRAGVTRHHRAGFAPIRALLNGTSEDGI